MAQAQHAPRDIEIAVGPHNSRPDWRVLRVNFDASRPEQQARVSEALKTLFALTTLEVKQEKEAR